MVKHLGDKKSANISVYTYTGSPKWASTCSRIRPVIRLRKTDPIIIAVAIVMVFPNLGSSSSEDFTSELTDGLLFLVGRRILVLAHLLKLQPAVLLRQIKGIMVA